MTLSQTETAAEQPRLQYALRRLSGVQKSTASAPAYLRFVNRPLGGYLAAVAFALRLTPTHVTALSAGCSAAGLALAGTQRPTLPMAVLVTLLMALGFALDSADGQLARIRGGGTKAGEWLDHVVDTPKTVLLHLVVLINLVRFQGVDDRSPYLLIPMAFVAVSMTLYFSMMLRDQLIGRSAMPTGQPGTQKHGLLISIALFPVDYGAQCLVFLLIPFTEAFQVAYAALFFVTLLFTVRSLAKTYRTIVAASAAALPGP